MTKNWMCIIFVVILLVWVIAVAGCTDNSPKLNAHLETKEIKIVDVRHQGNFKWQPDIIVSTEPVIYEMDGYDTHLYKLARTSMGKNVSIYYESYCNAEGGVTNRVIAITPLITQPYNPCNMSNTCYCLNSNKL